MGLHWPISIGQQIGLAIPKNVFYPLFWKNGV